MIKNKKIKKKSTKVTPLNKNKDNVSFTGYPSNVKGYIGGVIFAIAFGIIACCGVTVGLASIIAAALSVTCAFIAFSMLSTNMNAYKQLYNTFIYVCALFVSLAFISEGFVASGILLAVLALMLGKALEVMAIKLQKDIALIKIKKVI